MTVQLQDSLSTSKRHAGDQFRAILATALTQGGEILVKPGTAVIGRIESERLLPGHRGESDGVGYFKLTLSSMNVEGRQAALHTSSLFARGTLQSGGVVVRRGHLLTFRLTAPVELDEISANENTAASDSSKK
jgi:hypothetical protein